MPAWPATLPDDPLIQGYDERTPVTGIRTNMDAGPAKQRNRFTAAVAPLQLTLDLTRAQVAILDSFHKDTLKRGALAFDWIHPRTQAVVSFRFINDRPLVFKPVSQQDWRAEVALEILP